MFKKIQEGVRGEGNFDSKLFLMLLNLVDHKKPETYPIIKRIKKNKNANTYEEEMHLKNLEHMNRRIKTIGIVIIDVVSIVLKIGSYQQRKKNIHDPLVNPSKFFRAVGDEKGVSIKKFAKKVVSFDLKLLSR